MKKHIVLFILAICFYGSHAQNFTWRKKADLPDPNYQGANFTINNKVYVIGGVIDHINTPVNLNRKVWEYDPVADTWTQKHNAPGTMVFGASYFVIGNYGYIVNGWDSTNSAVGPSDCWRYDPANDTWAAMATFPGSQRYTCASFAINGKGYVVGGFRPYTDEVYEYNPATNTWAQKSAYPGGANQSMTTFVIGNDAYVGAGQPLSPGWAYFSSNYYKYDGTTDTWTQVASFPGAPLASEGTFVLDGNAYIVCGTTESQYNYQNGASGDIWKYDPTINNWSYWGVFPDTAIVGGNHVTCNGSGYVGQGEHFYYGTYSRVWWTFGPAAAGSYSCAATISKFKINNATYNFQASGNFSPSAILNWFFGDGSSATGTSVVHTYGATGAYGVTLVVVDSGQTCSSTSDSVHITNLSNCSVVAASQHLGSQYELYAAPSGSSGPYTYVWTNPNDSTFTSTLPDPLVNLQPNVATTYCVTIMDTTGCTASNCTTITYVPQTDSCATYVYIFPEGNIPGVYYAYVYHTGATPVSYSWSYGNGYTAFDSLPDYTYPTAGFFDVCLTITDSAGCVSSYCDSLFYAFKTGGGPIHELRVISRNALGVNDISAKSLVSVYPNPANSELNISVSGKIERITLYTAEGKKIKEITTPVANKVDINELAAGIYFVEVQSKEGTGRAKFVKANN